MRSTLHYFAVQIGCFVTFPEEFQLVLFSNQTRSRVDSARLHRECIFRDGRSGKGTGSFQDREGDGQTIVSLLFN